MNTKATQYLRGGKTTDIVIVASAPAVTGPASAATGTRGRVVGPGGGRGVMNRGRGAEHALVELEPLYSAARSEE